MTPRRSFRNVQQPPTSAHERTQRIITSVDSKRARTIRGYHPPFHSGREGPRKPISGKLLLTVHLLRRTPEKGIDDSSFPSFVDATGERHSPDLPGEDNRGSRLSAEVVPLERRGRSTRESASTSRCGREGRPLQRPEGLRGSVSQASATAWRLDTTRWRSGRNGRASPLTAL